MNNKKKKLAIIGGVSLIFVIVFIVLYFTVFKSKSKTKSNSNEDTTKEDTSKKEKINRVLECEQYLNSDMNDPKPDYCMDADQKIPNKQVCAKCKMVKRKNKDRLTNTASVPLCVNGKCCIIQMDNTDMPCPEFCMKTNTKGINDFSDSELETIFKNNCKYNKG